MKYIVCIEPGVWLSGLRGDPGRTLVERDAKRYKTVSSATYGLAYARKYGNFPNAEIQQVTS